MPEIDRVPLPPDPNTRPPRFKVPAGSWDTHFHVFGSPHLIPYDEKRPYTPPSAPIEHWLGMASVLGLERGVMVQPVVHGYDNSQVLRTLSVGDGKLRAIVRNNPDISKTDIDGLHAAGVRGIRFSFTEALHGHFDSAHLRSIVARVERYRWVLDFHVEANDIVRHAEILRTLPLPVIIDHFGGVIGRTGINQAALRVLLDLIAEGHIWVKFAAHDRLLHRGARYEDIVAVAQKLVARASDRIIWGTDWPHPYVYQQGTMPNDGDLIDMLLDFAPDDAVRGKILADNPVRLFGFD
jgi:predicted TIM-barrel fold metal-dependent hydrolase